MKNKLRGAFYTPSNIAALICERVLAHSLNNPAENRPIRVLEPSCGDGVFLQSLLTSNKINNSVLIDAIEIDEFTISQAKSKFSSVSFHRDDFLYWKTNNEYDIVVGNPPYIHRKNLTQTQTTTCKKIHIQHGLSSKEVSNIWTAFVLKSTSLLNDNGILSFVLPTDLLQTNFSEEIRRFLINSFERIEIISFRDLAFNTIEQDTVVLFAYKTASEKGLYFIDADSSKRLRNDNLSFAQHDGNMKSKWTMHILSQKDIDFIYKLCGQCGSVSDYCFSSAGIVTAANNFFILNSKDADSHELSDYTHPIIPNGTFINGSLNFSSADFEEAKEMGKACLLLDLNNTNYNELPSKVKSYLEQGKELEIHSRYKCRQRKNWYEIPSIWKSEAFFFRRSNLYPKLIANNADILVTDAAYRIKMKKDYNLESFIVSFYNSFTLLCSELFGRYYGGGVLEMTPNEFRKLPIPYLENDINFGQVAKDFKKKKDIESFLETNDKTILKQTLDISDADVAHIRSLYKRLKNRRLRKFT